MFGILRSDIKAVFERDPACRSLLEVLICYPGLHALALHRLAHSLWQHRFLLLARFVSHLNRFLTGIEIHPGARIGKGVFIDHGMGVVIGETAEVGDLVTMYQGVVLGGTGKDKGKRHPTVGDHVVLGAHAKVLGALRIGEGARIGAGAVVLRDVPPHATVVGIPGRVVKEKGLRVTRTSELDHADLPDPVEAALRSMMLRIGQMEKRIQELEEGASSLVDEASVESTNQGISV